MIVTFVCVLKPFSMVCMREEVQKGLQTHLNNLSKETFNILKISSKEVARLSQNLDVLEGIQLKKNFYNLQYYLFQQKDRI
jgi:hypothetical protein